MKFKEDNFKEGEILDDGFCLAADEAGAENSGRQEQMDDIASGGKEIPINEMENFNVGAGQKIIEQIAAYLQENFPPEAMMGVSSLVFAVYCFTEALANKGPDSILPAAAGAAFTARAAVNFAKLLIDQAGGLHQRTSGSIASI